VKIKAFAISLVIGLAFIVSMSGTVDGWSSSIAQNVSMPTENQGQLIPWIGISDIEYDPYLRGVLVNEVTPGSPADDSGIRSGDMIIKVDNKNIKNVSSFNQIITKKQIGQNLMLDVLSDDQEKESNLVVGSRSAPKYEEASQYAIPGNVNFSTFESSNESHIVKIEYPSSWKITEEYEIAPYLSNTGPPYLLKTLFRSLPENATDLFQEQLELFLIPTQKQTLDEIISVDPKQVQILNMTEPHNSTISDNHAKALEYSYLDNTHGKMKGMNIATLIENTTFLITYQAEAARFDMYYPTIERMIGSFEAFKLLDYVNLDIGMKIKYPSYLNLTQQPHYRTKISESVQSVLLYPTSQNDTVQRSNEIRISSYGTEKSLDEEVNRIVSDYKDNFIGYQGFECLENPKNVTISSLIFKVLKYPCSDISNKTDEVDYLTKSGNIVYSISIRGTEHDSPEFLSAFRSIINSFEPEPHSVRSIIFGNYLGGVLLTLPTKYPWAIEELSNTTTDLMADQPNYLDKLTLSVVQYNGSVFELGKNDSRNMINVVKSNFTIPTTTGLSVTANKVKFVNPDRNTHEERVYAQYNNNTYIFRLFNGDSSLTPEIGAVIDSAKILEFVSPENLETAQYPGLGLDMSLPTYWHKEDNNVTFSAYPNSTDLFSSSFTVQMFPSSLEKLEDIVARDINSLSQSSEGFQILESNRTNIGGYEFHKIAYKYLLDQDTVEGLIYYVINEYKVYYFIFETSNGRFIDYTPVIDKIIDSIKFHQKQKPDEETIQSSSSGLKLGYSPIDVVVNPITNKLYVAPSEVSLLLVVNATTNTVVSNITIGGRPNSLAVNPVTNTIYATSPNTEKVYVIDGETDEFVTEVPIGRGIADIAVDASEANPGGLIFVTNEKNISIIDGLTNEVVRNVKFGDYQPYGIALDPLSNRAYVTGSSNITVGIVSVIGYTVDSRGTVLARNEGLIDYNGLFPRGIAVEPESGKVFVTNFGGDTVTEIDGYANQTVKHIRVGLFPNSIAINSNNSKVYVANTGDDTISVINATKPEPSSIPIAIDAPPYDVSINPNTNIIYSANPESGTISTIGSGEDDLLYTVRFQADPPIASGIACGEAIYPLQTYVKIYRYTSCTGVPSQNYIFGWWSGMNMSLLEHFFYGPNSLNVTGDGTYTASFLPSTYILQALGPYLSTIILAMTLYLTSSRSAFNRLIRYFPLRVSKHLQGIKHVPVNTDIDIISVDAAVIAGVLILLTLSGLAGSEQIQLGIVTINIIFPFAISGIAVLIDKKEFAIRMVNAGFIYLIISVILVVILLMPGTAFV
jgi:YVTN family beta-propeller protein